MKEKTILLRAACCTCRFLAGLCVKRNKLLAALVLLAGFAAAQEGETFSLRQTLDLAGNNNPALLASRQRWMEKQRSIAITSGWPMPEFGLMLDDIPSDGGMLGKPMMFEYSLSQEIMFPAKLIAMRNMAKSDAGMAGADFQVKQMQVYTAVKQAYYDLLYARQSLAVMKENLELMKQFNTVAQANYATGASPLQDTLRSQTEVSRMETEILNMESMETMAQNRLNYLLGREADTPLAIGEEFSSAVPEFDLAELRRLSQDNPAIQSMAWEVEMARNNVSMARAGFWPDFIVSFGFVQSTVMDPMLMKMVDTRTGRADYSLAMREANRNSWNVGFMVMLPLWFGQYRAKVQAAHAGVAAAQAALTDMHNMAGMDLSMAVNEARSARRLIDLYARTLIPQAEQTWQTVITAYRNGRGDFMMVMDSLTTLRNARLDYYKSHVDYEKALAGLEQIIGQPYFPAAEGGNKNGGIRNE
jgi:outer membrane protein TolC